jgi:hypothetical protein
MKVISSSKYELDNRLISGTVVFENNIKSPDFHPGLLLC